MFGFGTSMPSIVVLLLACCSAFRIYSGVSAFQVISPSHHTHWRHAVRISVMSSAAADDEVDNWTGDEELASEPSPPVKGIEKAWRYAKKPLLSIGSKGASASHGNSLRQLLESHTAVKVKVVNTQVFETPTLEGAFEQLRDLAVASGGPADMELLQTRLSERILFIGLPGTRERIESGDFPPEPVVWNKDKE